MSNFETGCSIYRDERGSHLAWSFFRLFGGVRPNIPPLLAVEYSCSLSEGLGNAEIHTVDENELGINSVETE